MVTPVQDPLIQQACGYSGMSPVVVVVTGARQLLDAMAMDCAHMEVKAHLDLTALDLPEQVFNAEFAYLGIVPPSVKSITLRLLFSMLHCLCCQHFRFCVRESCTLLSFVQLLHVDLSQDKYILLLCNYGCTHIGRGAGRLLRSGTCLGYSSRLCEHTIQTSNK